jgi:asparagine synthase (glutamine-hydrolysing)
MGGLAGAVALNGNREISPSTLECMLRWIAHRGPAGATMRQRGNVAIGVRHTHMPVAPEDEPLFVSADGQLWAAIDGRIFNAGAVRETLERRRFQFTGPSPAELIARLYEADGASGVAQLEGEFALVVWDGLQKRLYAARDRLGVRHLFYALLNGTVYFASEIKAILGSGAVERRLDLQALDQVLFMNCPVAPRTMFAGISALPAGHYLLVQDGQARHKAYWDLEYDPAPPGARSEESYEAEFLTLLRAAVAARIPSSGPVGVYLSGGLDSSTITALMRERIPSSFPAHFVDFGLAAYTERQYACLAAERLGVALNVTEMTAERIAENFPRLIWHGEAPVVLAEAASLLPLAQAAAHDVQVVLNGEGGDELLAGYVFNEWDRVYRTLQRFPLSLTLPLIRAALPALGFPKAFVLSRAAQRSAYEHLHCFPAPLYYNYAVREVTAYYSDSLRAQLRGYCPEAEIAQGLNVAHMEQWDPLSQSLYFSTKINLPNYLLGPHGDRAAAAAGIEAFFPFLDHHLMEFAARLPNDLKVRGSKEKYLLKTALRDIVPAEIVQRKKSPMTSPSSPAFLGPGAPDYVQQLLSPQTIAEKGSFDSNRVAAMVKRLRQHDPARDRNNRMDVMLSFPLVGVLSVQILDELYIANLYEQAPTWGGKE